MVEDYDITEHRVSVAGVEPDGIQGRQGVYTCQHPIPASPLKGEEWKSRCRGRLMIIRRRYVASSQYATGFVGDVNLNFL
jgi:hypothetical protein